MKAGDLVAYPNDDAGWTIGIVVEMIDGIEVPPVAQVLFENGKLIKEWTDELVLVNETR